jgi:hypothetical protein
MINYSILFIFMFSALACHAGYGDATGGYPSWRERQILVLSGACRMAPAQYRAAYVGNYAILDPAKYPPVFPLYWNAQLNRSARAHCLDMGDTCGIMQHNSCNGDTWSVRIKRYYTASSWIGENIAVGNADPFAIMNLWLIDKVQSTGLPAADLSCPNSAGCDGHRSNIMSTNYREFGTGYTYGTKAGAAYHNYWTQDFGGGKTAFTNHIAGASHFFITAGSTTFLADYYDSAQRAPQSAFLYCNGAQTVLTLAMGVAWRGTYQAALPQASACRTYFFIFKDSAGTTWRYPETGGLITTGEGGCSREFVPAESLAVLKQPPRPQGNMPALRSSLDKNGITILVTDCAYAPRSTRVLDCRGALGQVFTWPPASLRLHGLLAKRCAAGIYFMEHRFAGGRKTIEQRLIK